MNHRIVAPLSEDDIQWTAFVDDQMAIHAGDRDDDVLFVLSEDEVRDYCRNLRADLRGVSATLHEAVAMLRTVTAQRDRLRDQNRQLRDWNNQLATAAEILQREAAA